LGIRTILPAMLAAVAAIAAWPARAASFDCARASQADEVAVCRSPELSALDSEMGGLWFGYAELPFLMGRSGIRQDEAREFLEERRACAADVGCLEKLYQARIATLRDGLKNGIAELAADRDAASAWPAPVQGVIAGYGEQCQQLGGSLAAGGSQPNIVTGDFDGDGITDYLLDSQPLQCSAAATAFCGNGGCQVDIAVSGAGFAPVDALGGQPTLSLRQEGAEVALWVSGANCPGLLEVQDCWQVLTWNGGKPGQRYEARPRPGP
jgi:uncharacterized protein